MPQCDKARDCLCKRPFAVRHEESQDGCNQQNAGNVVLEVQKLVGTALTDNQVSSVYTLVDSDTQTECYPITDVQPVNLKYVAPRVRKATVKLASAGAESSGSIHYALQFLCCGPRRTNQQAVVVVYSTRLSIKARAKDVRISR